MKTLLGSEGTAPRGQLLIPAALSLGKQDTAVREETQSPIQWVPGALSLGLRWPGREDDHSPYLLGIVAWPLY
jgi:hypothetical protein